MDNRCNESYRLNDVVAEKTTTFFRCWENASFLAMRWEWEELFPTFPDYSG